MKQQVPDTFAAESSPLQIKANGSDTPLPASESFWDETGEMISGKWEAAGLLSSDPLRKAPPSTGSTRMSAPPWLAASVTHSGAAMLSPATI